jgi:MerR family transcriptional regulator/heat shock protein HspR
MKRKKGFYSISVVAKMFSVHQQTIRMYEKEGLICPKRSSGNTRLFSEEDVDRLEQIIYLTHKMGVNLAGVEMILKLQKKMKKMQSEMNKMFEKMQKQLDEESMRRKKDVKEAVPRLSEMKKIAKAGCRSQKASKSVDSDSLGRSGELFSGSDGEDLKGFSSLGGEKGADGGTDSTAASSEKLDSASESSDSDGSGGASFDKEIFLADSKGKDSRGGFSSPADDDDGFELSGDIWDLEYDMDPDE